MPTSAPRKKAAPRSGNPARRAEVASVADFKQPAIEVELPSGKTIALRRLGLTQLMAEGLLGDELSGIAQKAVDSGKGMTAEDGAKLAQDPSKVRAMLEVFDKITVRTWVRPRVVDGTDVPEAERDDATLYADEIDIEDKIFTFNYASGGSADLVRFREQFGESLGGLSAVEGMVDPAE